MNVPIARAFRFNDAKLELLIVVRLVTSNRATPPGCSTQAYPSLVKAASIGLLTDCGLELLAGLVTRWKTTWLGCR